MKRIIALSLVIALFASVLLSGCIPVTVTGSGKLITESFDFNDFNEVKAESGFQLEITESSTFSIEITTDDNVLQYIKVDKSGDTLKIRTEEFHNYRSVTFKAKITMPDFYKIDLSGGSRADISGFSSSNDFSVDLSGGSRVFGDMTTGDADFDLSGGSDITLDGTAGDLRVEGSGGSKIRLEDYPVINLDIDLSGGSSATVNVGGILDADLSGGSDVNFVGNPQLGSIDLSGSSTLNKK